MPTGVYSRGPVAARFWAKVRFVFFGDACWEWQAYKNHNGYGEFSYGGRARLASRVAYELSKRKFDPKLKVLHTCDNPACVNPQHLFLGTQQDNLKDMRDKGRDARGETQGMSKLTEADVIAIRASTGLHRDVAAQYGIHEDHIGRIKARRRWAHLA